MAIITTDDKHYKAIADAIRLKASTVQTYTPEEMPQGVQFAHDAGYLNGWEDGKQNGIQSVYETIVIAQDCTNAKQAYNLFAATNSPTDKMVLFVNKSWTAAPNAGTTNNQGLFMLWLNEEFTVKYTPTIWGRWRDGEYNVFNYVNDGFSYTVLAGEEWLRVVLM